MRRRNYFKELVYLIGRAFFVISAAWILLGFLVFLS